MGARLAFWAWATAFIALPAIASSSSASSSSAAATGGLEEASYRLLIAHNQARAEVGAPPLQWDPYLAQSAASYGPALASLGRLVHSPRTGREEQRENLWMGPRGHYRPEEMVSAWVDERRLFEPGTFPNVSRTGRWKDVAHYTQMIWKSTTRVGCAIHQSGQWDYLICRYSPPGNADGRPVP